MRRLYANTKGLEPGQNLVSWASWNQNPHGYRGTTVTGSLVSSSCLTIRGLNIFGVVGHIVSHSCSVLPW